MGTSVGQSGKSPEDDRKRHTKLTQLAASLPNPAIHGAEKGDLLIVGWGSTFGPIKEATDRLLANGHRVGAINLRHLHPFPHDLGNLFDSFDHIIVPEMNDSGAYGCGQLAMLLRAKTCNPKIQSLNKVEGGFRVVKLPKPLKASSK